MKNVLWDVMRADEMVEYQISIDSSINRKEKSLHLYQQIFGLHKITAQQFKHSFNYYQAHPRYLKPVLDSLRSLSNKPQPAAVTPPKPI